MTFDAASFWFGFATAYAVLFLSFLCWYFAKYQPPAPGRKDLHG